MPDLDEKLLEGEFILETDSASTVPEKLSAKKDNEKKSLHKSHVKKSPHFFSSYCPYPKAVTFQDQEKDEEIILLIRKHFITNVPWITSTIVFSLFPIILFPLILAFSPFPIPTTFAQLLIIAFYYLVLMGFVLLKFTLWYFHVGIITNIRIRDIDIHGILYKDIAETKYEQIQDVNYTQIGFIRSLFNYGEVLVQTAGTLANIQFDKAPKPTKIARVIGNMIGK